MEDLVGTDLIEASLSGVSTDTGRRPKQDTSSETPTPAGKGPPDLTRYGIEFDRTNRVAPGEDLNDQAGTLNVLGPGRHMFREDKRLLPNNGVGIVGAGGPGDVVIETPVDEWTTPLVARCDRDFLLANVTVDQRNDRRTGSALKFLVGDNLQLHDIRFVGEQTDEEWCPQETGNSHFAPHVTDPDGTGDMSGFDWRAHGVVKDYPTGLVPSYIGPSHSGALTIAEPHVEYSAMHSFYASRSNGEVHVRGGLFRNNNNTMLRLSQDSTVKGARFVLDAPPSRFEAPSNREPQSTELLLWERAKWNGSSGGLVEDCEFVVTSEVSSQGTIVVDGSCGEFTARNCRIHNTTQSCRNIVAEERGSNVRGITPPAENWVRVENCTLSGDGRHRLVTDRRGSVDVS